MTPLAGGGDGGGSIRIPAACCGLFGFKPTRGRTPTGPEHGELWHGFTVEHVITRSVRDSAAMLDAIGGPDPGAPYFTPAPARPFLQEVSADPGRLRIAFTSKPFLGNRVHNDCQQALIHTIKLLNNVGHEVVEDAPVFDGLAFARAFLTLVCADTAADIRRGEGLLKRKASMADFETATWALHLIGKQLSGVEIVEAKRFLQSCARQIGQFFTQYDLLVTPTLAEPPALHGALQPKASELLAIKVLGRLRAGVVLKAIKALETSAATVFNFIPYTPVFNVTGQPAMSVPLYWNRMGLPIGLHFVGRFGEDATLFRLAGQLEQAQPWFARTPTLGKATTN
jgi:amidase